MPSCKILSVVGARPQFIKMAVVSSAIQASEGLEEIVVHTGQHADTGMSDVFFSELGIPAPQYHLGLSGTGSDDVVEQMQEGIVQVIRKENPDWVLVYGDTYSTRAGAQAAEQERKPLAHVEAGLRSHDLSMPEEQNRLIADRASKVLFAPTKVAMAQLAEEGLTKGRDIILTGDVMYDAILKFSGIAEHSSAPEGAAEKDFILCTIHRAATTDDKKQLTDVVKALNALSQRYKIVFPVHPRTAKQLKAFGLQLAFPTHPPLSYLTMLKLLRSCRIVLTDSGGLQKEAFFSRKFCVTVREETEWTELVDGGYNVLSGTDPERIIEAVKRLWSSEGSFDEAYYGQGDAAEKIAAYFRERLR